MHSKTLGDVQIAVLLSPCGTGMLPVLGVQGLSGSSIASVRKSGDAVTKPSRKAGLGLKGTMVGRGKDSGYD